MKIIIKGKPTKVDLSIIRAALHWYAVKLMGSRLTKNITIKINFSHNLKKHNNTYAECKVSDYNSKPRKFNILIDSELRCKTMLLSLAHEMVHVKQFARKELVEFEDGTVFKWFGNYMNDIVYWEQPWEIEAHGRELGLYIMWLESLNC